MTPQVPAEHASWHELSEMYALGELDGTERQIFEAHLEDCHTCQHEVRLLGAALTGMTASVPQHAPPSRLRRQVLQAAGSPDWTKSASQQRGWARDVRAYVGAPVLGASALLILTVVIGTLMTQAHVHHVEARLSDTSSRTSAVEQQIANAQQAASKAERMASVLAAPDLRHFDLAGQPPASNASGRALWSRSGGLVLIASHLPPLPPKSAYQAWILTSGAPVSAGLLALNTAEGGSLVVETRQDLPDPTGFAVSIEPEGGGSAPSGAIYLAPKSAPVPQ